MGGAPKDYVDVAERIVEFRTKHPNGSLQKHEPLEWVRNADGVVTGVIYTAAAYRDVDDPRPGIGTSYEDIPGKTSFTRGSEVQNAETSAWGRAIIACGAADAKRGVATQQDVDRSNERNRESPSPGGQEKPAELEVARVRRDVEAKLMSKAVAKEDLIAFIAGFEGKEWSGLSDVDNVKDLREIEKWADQMT